MNIRITPARFAALSFLASLQLPALAQSGPLPETVVSASRVEQPLAEVLPSVTLITREDIERSQAASLADLLQGEAGFEFGRNGGPGTTTSFFLRGAESKNLVVMIDGERTMVDGWGSLTSIDLPLSQIERIELLRGNASALYGEAAVGGVLQIFTRNLAGPTGGDASVSAGSRGSRALTAGYAGRTGDLSYRFDAGSEHTDGYSAMNPTQNAKVNPDNDAYDVTQFSGKVSQRISEKLTLGASARMARSDAGYDDGTSSAVNTDTHLLRRENSTLNLYADGRINANWTSQFNLSRSNLEMRDYKNDAPKLGLYDSSLSTGQQTAMRWFNTYVSAAGRIYNFGVESGNEFYTANATSSGYRATRELFGYFAGLNQKFGAWSLQANVRQDTVQVNKHGTTYQKHWDNTSGLLGLGYQLSETWRLTGTVSSGFRAPSAGELSNNIDLKPEHHVSHEAGVAYASGRTSMRVVAFDTRTTDAIYWQSVSPWTPINVGKVRNQGVEVAGTARLGSNHIQYAYVTQDPWNESDGTRLARRARQYGSVDVGHDLGATKLGVKLYASGDRYDSGAPGKTLPGYSTVGFYASRAIDKDWTVRMKLENVFNSSYQLANGYDAPPFGAWVTLAYKPR